MFSVVLLDTWPMIVERAFISMLCSREAVAKVCFCIVTGSVGESSLTGEGNIHREVQEFR